MANQTTWVMNVPVISTVHMPGPFEPERIRDLGDQPVALFDDGMFLFIGSEVDGNEYEGDNAWLAPISRWLDEHFHPADRWVRFSGGSGDIIDELPKFDWP